MKHFLICYGLIGPSLLYAQVSQQIYDPINIFAEEKSLPSHYSASSVQVFNESDLKPHQQSHLDQFLKTNSSIQISQNGGPGQPSSLFLRGNDWGHVLIIKDGIPLNDASSINRGTDLSQISLHNIGRIEIIKKPQSVRYGANALGGVIHLYSKKSFAATPNIKASIASENTQKLNLSAEKKYQRSLFKLSSAYARSDGLSAAEGGSERDGFESFSFSPVISGNLNRMEWNLKGQFRRSQTDLDQSGGTQGDDPNYTSEVNDQSISLQTLSRWFNDDDTTVVKYHYRQLQRNLDNQPDNKSNKSFQGIFDSTENRLGLIQNVFLNDQHSLQIGLDKSWEDLKSHETFDDKSSSQNYPLLQNESGYITYEQMAGGFSNSFGGRIDHHSSFGLARTYELDLSYQAFSNAPTFSIGRSTAFKTPSLYQLYSKFGNTELAPEKSVGHDFAIKHSWKTGHFSLTHFINETSNLIDYDFTTNKFLNLTASKIQGQEYNFEQKLPYNSILTLGFTRTLAVNSLTNQPLLRRPQYSGNAIFHWQYNDDFSFNLQYNYRGKRKDLSPTTFEMIDQPSYALWDLTTTWQVNKKQYLQLGLRNLFDKDYQTVAGYTQQGLNWSVNYDWTL